MSQNITSLSSEEADLLLRLAGHDKNIFTVEDAYQHWNGDPNTPFRLRNLEAKGWLQRLERGTYLIVPLEAGPDRQWTEDAYVLAAHLIEPSAIAYWSALHQWTMTEQVPRITYIQSTSRKSVTEKQVLGLPFRFVTVARPKFFGLHEQHADHQRYFVTDKEKTIIDCLDRLELAGGVAHLSEALRTSWEQLDWNRMDSYLVRFSSRAVVKRLGFLVEAMSIAVPDRDERLAKWMALLSAGLSKLDPSSPREAHRIETKWRILVNADEACLGARS